MYSFPNLVLVCCSMSSSSCCFLTCIQISQVACMVIWYSHLFNNFPQFVVIHTVKGFGVVNKAIDVFLELSCFFNDPTHVGNLISGFSAFSKSSLNIWNFFFYWLTSINIIPSRSICMLSQRSQFLSFLRVSCIYFTVLCACIFIYITQLLYPFIHQRTNLGCFNI